MHNQSLESSIDPFTARFGLPLPRGLRDEATGMGWTSLCQTYEQSGGPVRLGQWSELPAPATSVIAPRTYRATMAIGERIETSTATASGPMAALTAMLAGRGLRMETLSFHQFCDGDHTVTFVRCSNGTGAKWAMGRAADAEASSLRAMIACANRLRLDPRADA